MQWLVCSFVRSAPVYSLPLYPKSMVALPSIVCRTLYAASSPLCWSRRFSLLFSWEYWLPTAILRSDDKGLRVGSDFQQLLISVQCSSSKSSEGLSGMASSPGRQGSRGHGMSPVNAYSMLGQYIAFNGNNCIPQEKRNQTHKHRLLELPSVHSPEVREPAIAMVSLSL